MPGALAKATGGARVVAVWTAGRIQAVVARISFSMCERSAGRGALARWQCDGTRAVGEACCPAPRISNTPSGNLRHCSNTYRIR